MLRPIMTDLTFENNSAPYGPDIGSYPSKIMLVDESGNELTDVQYDDVGSGIQFKEEI